MTQRTEVRLDADNVRAYHIQGRQVWVQTDTHETVLRVPRTNKATYWPRGERAVIHAGNFMVSGPLDKIRDLWDTICDTTPTK